MKEKIYFSVDPVVFTLSPDNKLKVLLIKQQAQPFEGKLRFPGGLIDTAKQDALDQAAHDILLDKTSVSTNFFEQLKTYGGLNRDPRGWTVATAYIGVVNHSSIEENANNVWLDVSEAINKKLAFDHNTILIDAVQRLKSKVNYSLLPVHFLPEEFTMSSLQKIYESILEEKIDKSSFLKKIKDVDAVEPINGKFLNGDFRPAQLWRVKKMHNFNRNLKVKP